MSAGRDGIMFERQLADDAATIALARELSLFVVAGDWIGLTGDLGAGKTTLARGLIRALSGSDVEVPSPTFTLVQTYETRRMSVAHFDLYRLEDAAEVDELGIDELNEMHLVLVEWPDRIEDQLPADRLMIDLKVSGDGRTVALTGHGRWQMRLERMVAARDFLNAHAPSCERRFLQGDASARRYERITTPDGEPQILMDMPAKADPRPADGGPTYSEIVHLADDIVAVAAINQELRAAGYSAPAMPALDVDGGFAIIEDLGDRVFGQLEGYGKQVSPPLRAAVDVLADMAGKTWPTEFSVGVVQHTVAAFDSAALLGETELLMSWFWPLLHNSQASDERRAEFEALWRPLFDQLDMSTLVWVLRDYHSPNLIWLPERDGLARVGIIDTQDAVLGSPAYDLASLLQDARLDVAEHVEAEMMDHYLDLRLAADAGFDADVFGRDYAVLGAQRATKILGIFARLSKRDGKHGYLHHIPRVSRLLERNLQHSALGNLKAWFDTHLSFAKRNGVGT